MTVVDPATTAVATVVSEEDLQAARRRDPPQPGPDVDHVEERVGEVEEHGTDRRNGGEALVLGRLVGGGEVEQGAHGRQSAVALRSGHPMPFRCQAASGCRS